VTPISWEASRLRFQSRAHLVLGELRSDFSASRNEYRDESECTLLQAGVGKSRAGQKYLSPVCFRAVPWD
jgi:hypothetical protein